MRVITIAWRKSSVILIIFALLLAVGSIGTSLGVAAAKLISGKADVEININGGDTAGGELVFRDSQGEDVPWYPGLEKKGTIRINNNAFQRVKIHSLGMTMKLNDPDKYDLFADNMHFTIKKGRILDFDSTPLYEGKLRGFLYQENNQQYTGLPVSLVINRYDYLDLEYAVTMDLDATNEMQGLVAEWVFTINMNEEGGSNSNRPKSNRNKDSGSQADSHHWAHDCIKTLIAHGILIPDPDGSVRPDDFITRAETADLLGRALHLKELKGSKTVYLDDDQLPEWARGYIAACYEAGVMVGYEMYPGREFRPDKFTPREELCCVFVRAFKKELSGDLDLTFNDTGDISGWALNHVKAAIQNGIMEGYPDNTFKPKQPMTRAEAFTIVCKFLGYHVEHM